MKKKTQSGKTHNKFTNTAVLSSNFTRVAAVAGRKDERK